MSARRRSSYSMSRFRARRRKYRPTYAWRRTGPFATTTMAGGSPEVYQPLAAYNVMMPASSGGSSTELDFSRSQKLVIERIILSVVMIVTNSSVKALLEYFWGLRIRNEPTDAGNSGIATVGDVPVLNEFGKDGLASDWLYRGNAHLVVSGVAADIQVIPSVGVPEKTVVLDYKPRRPFLANDVLYYQHKLQTTAGAWPDVTITGRADAQILFSRSGRPSF